MLKTILTLIVIVVVIVLIVASTKPATFRVERTSLIAAPPERVHALIDDMHAFNSWNPWLKRDPALKGVYSGPTHGKGAGYAWESDKVGTGSMEIVDSTPAASVRLKLDFLKPIEGHNFADFTLVPEAGSAAAVNTRVTWAMYGPANFMSKVMQVFISMDRMVGKDFEEGLASMKALAESR
jgi:uncharacterized protein YndB with AHSA1/START domain